MSAFFTSRVLPLPGSRAIPFVVRFVGSIVSVRSVVVPRRRCRAAAFGPWPWVLTDVPAARAAQPETGADASPQGRRWPGYPARSAVFGMRGPQFHTRAAHRLYLRRSKKC
ncbi:hypothetical protein PSP6_170055 [Paraburkholderia tropica]|nr:hypothetical protein PSP6_170055 [Paraburkholderia tropica]